MGQALKTNEFQLRDEIFLKIDELPTLAPIANQVNELLNDPYSSVNEIAKILSQDQVLTAKVLKLANSPYYNIPGGVSDLKRALTFLGFNTLAQIVLGVSVFDVFSKSKNNSIEFPLAAFWKHSLSTAVISEVFAKEMKLSKPQEIFTCGLLHDIGKVVLYTVLKSEFLKIVEDARKNKISFIESEKLNSQIYHTEVGEYLLTKWNLPKKIILSVRYHHDDFENLDFLNSSDKKCVQIVSLAQELSHYLKFGFSGSYKVDLTITSKIQDFLSIDKEKFEELIKKIHGEYDKASVFLTLF
jgi:putative nucleotidyltransferase with HDIG domain